MTYQPIPLRNCVGIEAYAAGNNVGILTMPRDHIANPTELRSALEQMVAAEINAVVVDLTYAPVQKRTAYLRTFPAVQGTRFMLYVGLRDDEIGAMAHSEREARALRIKGCYAQNVDAAVKALSESHRGRSSQQLPGLGLIEAAPRPSSGRAPK